MPQEFGNSLQPPSKRARLTIPAAGIDSEPICDRCSQFDFESILDPLNETPPSGGRPVKPYIDAITAATEVSACPLCRLFAAVRCARDMTVFKRSGRYHLRCWSILKIYGLNGSKARTALKPSVIIAVEEGYPAKKIPYGLDVMPNDVMPYGVIAPVISDPSQSLKPFTLLGSVVDPKAVNFNQVQKWLSHCEVLHTDVCEALVTSRPTLLKVIDCDAMEIVPMAALPSDVQYFALSYVWGTKTDHASSPYRTSLSCSELPQVIQDAIEVVKNLREKSQRYLWVDRYCIDQSNLEEKHRQIKSMDSIYEGANATIVAASGNGAECGLPGVGPVFRLPQPAALVNGKQLVSTLPHISYVLKDTAWMTRGWTYQEAMLSRRCIIFTDLQVYFICQKSTCCEAMNKHDGLRAPGDELPTALFRPRVMSGPRIKGALDLFSDHVEHFSQRKLSHDTDALNAFKGMLARSPFYSFWGIPILNFTKQDAPDVGFAKGLAWNVSRGKRSLYRRQGFPSWSWTGWTVPAFFDLQYVADSTIFDITIWVELPGDDRKLVSLKSLQNAADTKIIEEISPVLHVDAYIVKVWFQRPHTAFSDRKSRLETYVFICWEHPNSGCECDKSMMTLGRAAYLHPQDDSDERVFDQPWDGVLLASGSGNHSVNVLIIEWHGSTAQRVGMIHSLSVDDIASLPKVRRRIRLE